MHTLFAYIFRWTYNWLGIRAYWYISKLLLRPTYGDSNYEHLNGELAKYKGNLLTIGGGYFINDTFYGNKKTEILEINGNRNLSWSVESDLEFTQGKYIIDYSLVTVEPSDIHEEYVLLFGGISDDYIGQENVLKFNGSWFLFGKLNKPRKSHKSIYWNGAVYVIGGRYDFFDDTTKIEIWDIKDSPDQFKTKENWPELINWYSPHLFIVPDSFFPDY